MGRGERLVSRPRLVRREAVVSLDTGRDPAMLFRCGSLIGVDVRQNSYSDLQLFLHSQVQARYEGPLGSRSKIFSILLSRLMFLHT
jgi:hypothetical protein